MSEVDVLRKEIAQTKAALSTKIDRLETQAGDFFSPIHQIEQHPLLAMGISLGAGFIVGSQIHDRRKLLEPLALGIFGALAGELEKKYLPRP